MKDAQSVVSLGDLSEMLGTIKEIIQAALNIEPAEMMDGIVGTMIKDTLGEAAKEFAKEALPIAGLVMKGVKATQASASLAKTILQKKEVERASRYLFNTGDIGKAMEALRPRAVCPLSSASNRPSAAVQIRVVLSSLAVTTLRPLGLNAAVRTRP